MEETVAVAIIGDFDPGRPSHRATNDALSRAADQLGVRLEVRWQPTPSLLALDGEKALERADGLWAAPGSPYRSLEGALKGIQFARERDRPFLGT